MIQIIKVAPFRLDRTGARLSEAAHANGSLGTYIRRMVRAVYLSIVSLKSSNHARGSVSANEGSTRLLPTKRQKLCRRCVARCFVVVHGTATLKYCPRQIENPFRHFCPRIRKEDSAMVKCVGAKAASQIPCLLLGILSIQGGYITDR